MSLVLLRQAFEPPLGAKDSAPGPSSTPVGAMQPHSLGTSLVYSTLPADSLTSTLVHQDAPSQVRAILTTPVSGISSTAAGMFSNTYQSCYQKGQVCSLACLSMPAVLQSGHRCEVSSLKNIHVPADKSCRNLRRQQTCFSASVSS